MISNSNTTGGGIPSGESPEGGAAKKRRKPMVLFSNSNPTGGGEPSSEDPENGDAKRRRKRTVLYIVAGILVAAIAVVAWLVISNIAEQKAKEQAEIEAEARNLDLQQQLADSEFENLENDFRQLETQRTAITNDTLKMRLTEKYEAARLQIEDLQKKLKDQRTRSSKEIKDLRGQIDSLRKLLKHYLEEIDRLNKENEELRSENAGLKDRNEQLATQVSETSRANQVLSERMTLAEKLNVTGVGLKALNKKGKNEKKVSKARQLMVTFTLPPNNSTPVGEKTIFVRIISPEGNLLGNGGTFPFEGGSVPCTARKVIEYTGEEIAGIPVYWDVTSALTAGRYTVELFADNYRLASRSFELK